MFKIKGYNMSVRRGSKQIKYAAISANTSGNNTLVPAVAGKRIKVLNLYLLVTGAVTIRFEDGADGTALSGVMSFAANGGLVLSDSEYGWFETSTGTLLNMELGGAVQVSGGLAYIELEG